jgi:hypothetical protein
MRILQLKWVLDLISQYLMELILVNYVKADMGSSAKVVHSESRTCPFILFLKDAEKSVAGNFDLYSAFQIRLEYLPENVIVICSQTHSDHLKDIGRQKKQGKEVPHATELLAELFENKITIQMPQDEKRLTLWKHQMDRDAETLKMKANYNHLRMGNTEALIKNS